MPIMAPVGSPLWEDLELEEDAVSVFVEIVVVPVGVIDTVTNDEVGPVEVVVTAVVDAELEKDAVGVVEEELKLPGNTKNGFGLGTGKIADGVVRGLCRTWSCRAFFDPIFREKNLLNDSQYCPFARQKKKLSTTPSEEGGGY